MVRAPPKPRWMSVPDCAGGAGTLTVGLSRRDDGRPARLRWIVAALKQAVAVGRLDAALAGNPLRRAWTFWSELDAARQNLPADSRLPRQIAPGARWWPERW